MELIVFVVGVVVGSALTGFMYEEKPESVKKFIGKVKGLFE